MKITMIVLTALLLVNGWTAGSATAPRSEKIFWGKSIHGVQAGLSLADGETTFTQGQSVTFKLLLRNVGKKPIILEAEGYIDSAFNWSALTQERTGKVLIGRQLNVNGRYPSPFTLTLAPGETQTLDGPAPKFRLAVMGNSVHTEPVAIMKPGAYRIQAAPFLPHIDGKDNWVHRLVTGTLPIKVLDVPGTSGRP